MSASHTRRFGASLNTQILIAAFIGLAIGLYLAPLPEQDGLRQGVMYVAKLLSTLFIGGLKLVLIPIILCSIVVGFARLGEHRHIGVVWRTTLLFYALTLTIAVSLSLLVANWVRPGAGLNLQMFAASTDKYKAEHLSAADFLQQFVSGLLQDPIQAIAQNNIMAVVCFAVVVGMVMVRHPGRFANTQRLFEEMLDILLFVVSGIMRFAPFGIAALLLQLVVKQDMTLLLTVGKFAAMVTGMTLVHGMIVLPGLLWLITRISPLQFWRGSRESLVTAFATSSSAATMPVTLRCVQNNFGASPAVSGFVVPVGTTLNMDGTAIYEAAAALFIANLAGVELNLVQQMIVCFMSMIGAMGAPGIPSVGMLTMVMVLQSVGLPVEAIAILLPIDRPLDTFRTAVNVEGDIVATLVVQHRVDAQAAT